MNTAQHEMQYKYYRNKLNHILQIAARKHYTYLLNNNKSNLKKTVSPSEINKIVCSIKNGAPAHDEISSGKLRPIYSHINELIAYLCDLYFMSGIFP